MHLHTLCIVGSLALTGCSSIEPAYDVAGMPPQYPLASTSPSEKPAFTVDAARDFSIEFGRGSGREGMDTVALSSDGSVTLVRLTTKRDWATATMRLSRSSLERILSSIRDQRIMFMADAYHADIDDGNQWRLSVRQGDRQKAIYFNNHFPEGILSFAAVIDAELRNAGEASLHWKLVPRSRGRS